MLGTVALDQGACLFKLHSAGVHVCSFFSQPAAQSSLPQGQQTYLPLRMFDYVTLDHHTCLKPSSYFCNSFTRLTACFSILVLNVASNQHACLLQLHSSTWQIGYTSRYGLISCNWLTNTSVVVWLNKQVYIYVTLASDTQICPYICSYPTNGPVSTIAPSHHECILQLHMTRCHVFIRRILSECTSVTVSSYQHPCILHLHLAISHVCNNCTPPFPMSFTIASNQQLYHSVKLCLQACMSDILAPDQHT